MLRPTTIEDLQAAVREGGRLLPRGGGTKPALSTPTEGVTPLDLSGLSGVLEYNPGEFTFTALAGTRVAEVQALLDSHGQYLPFDPPLADRGATLGGTVAAGVSGPGRYRYGGVRDFILGVRMVDGNGDVVYGGGKVVVQLHCAALQETMQALYRVYTARLDVDALDLAPETDGSATLWVRLGGLPDALPARAERIRAMLGGGDNVTGEREAWLWREARDFAWAQPDWILVKVPVTPKRIASVETLHATSLRRYSAAGNVAWIASPESPQSLDGHLSSVGLSGLMLFGPPGHARLGIRTGQAVERRVKEVFDPQNRFSET
ncbi:MAG: FAD-binding protein [Chloroflexi bacterium]|nr:FAD-binding protein [Chloroflexota bacterium]